MARDIVSLINDDDGNREAASDGQGVHEGIAAILSFQSGILSNIDRHCLVLGGVHHC